MSNEQEKPPLSPFEAGQYSPLTLAFIGDAVYELMARGRVISEGSAPVGKLHRKTVGYVKADAQARAVRALASVLTEEESNILRRGRNANTAHVAKHAAPADYRAATGLEALFGYLYLSGQKARLRVLFDHILADAEAAAEKANA